MSYVKNTWKDQDVERPRTYEVTNNQDGSITLTDSFGLVTELGTPVNAVNMNHIEDGIAELDNSKADKDKVVNHTQIPPVLINAPNGVFTNSGNSITVKQGLRFTLPNGVNVDGTLNNTEYEVTEDITQTISPEPNTYSTLFFAPNEAEGNKIAWFENKIYYIQDTEPFTPATGIYGIWFSRKDNMVRYSLSGSAWTEYTGIAIGTVKTDANRNVTNIYPYTPIRIPDVSMVDSSWIKSPSTFVNNVSLNTTTDLDIDLSNYLPNDNCEYLVEITWSIYGAVFARMAFYTSFGLYTVNTHAVSSANNYTDGCNKIIVGKDRIIRMRRENGWNNIASVSALGYRRLGTNA